MAKKKSKETYGKQGVPLTASIAEGIMIQLYDGRTLRRDEIAKGVIKFHTENKGLPPKNELCIKVGLSKLQKQGQAQNISPGYWKIGSRIHDDDVDADVSAPDEVEIIDSRVPPFKADKIIGKGTGGVYVYYLEAYKERAVAAKEKIWECKIGSTEGNAHARIGSFAASLPEWPNVPLEIRTDNPLLLEKAIHKILAVRGKRIDTTHGKEWFLTSPQEVEKIARFILQMK